MEEDKLTSSYNEAGYQITRLHNIWLESKILREKGELIGYKWKLDSATIELWADATRLDKDAEDHHNTEEIQEFDNKIIEAEKEKDFKKLYALLIQKEKALRRIQEESGKGAILRPAEDDFM